MRNLGAPALPGADIQVGDPERVPKLSRDGLRRARRPAIYALLALGVVGLAACGGGGAERRRDYDAGGGGDAGAIDAPLDVPTGSDAATDTTGTGGSGGGLKEMGATCAASGECRSGHCFDGVCCLSDCSGVCQSCAVAGTVGTCVNVPVGSDPRGDCPDDGVTGCGRDGTCDGTGECAFYGAGAICTPQSCTAATVMHAARCDGEGTCVAATSDSCGKYMCSTTGSCRATCATDADCVAGNACVNGSCGPKPPGAACAAAGDCASGHCEQGVCCATACSGTCQSCAIMGSEGQCTAVPSGADPLGQCGDQGATSCGTDGTCDGTGACRFYAGGTVCGAPACTNAAATPARTCNGGGLCLVVLPAPCSPYACGATACKTSCASDADCVAPNVCVASQCGPSGAGGAGGATGSGGVGGAAGDTGGVGGTGGGAGAGATGGAGGASGVGGIGGVGGGTGGAGATAGSAAAGTGGASAGSGGGTAGGGGAAGSSGAGGIGGAAGGSAGASGMAGTGGRGGAAGAGTGGGGMGGVAGTGGAGCAGYVFCDDFEDGNANGWTPNGGTWSVITDGSHVYEGGSGTSMSLAGQASWTDQTVQARVKVVQFGGTSTSYRAGIVARATDASNLYAFAIDASGAMRLLQGTSSPGGTGATGTCGKVSVAAVAGTWYTLQMKVSGSGTNVVITTFLDGTMIHNCQTTMGTLNAGAIGTYIYGPNTIAEFDDVRVSTP